MAGFTAVKVPLGRLVLFGRFGLQVDVYDREQVPSKFRLRVLRWLFWHAEYVPNERYEKETQAAIEEGLRQEVARMDKERDK